jgi:hypothetical protein
MRKRKYGDTITPRSANRIDRSKFSPFFCCAANRSM